MTDQSRTCSRCKSANSSDQIYCRTCGLSLDASSAGGVADFLPIWLVSGILRVLGRAPRTEQGPLQPGQCARCRQINRNGVAFCNNCGQHLG